VVRVRHPARSRPPRPLTATCRHRRSRGWAAAVGITCTCLFARSVCGYCEFQHHRLLYLAARARLPTPHRDPRADPRRGRCWDGRSAARRGHGFFGGGTRPCVPAADPPDPADEVRQRLSGWPRVPRSPPRPTPDSVTRESLAQLSGGGITRVSFGMQSALPSLARPLTGPTTPSGAAALAWAREAASRGASPDLRGTWESRGRLGRQHRGGPTALLTHLLAYAPGRGAGTKLAARVASRPAADAPRTTMMPLSTSGRPAACRRRVGLVRDSALGAQARGRVRANLANWRDGDWWASAPSQSSPRRRGALAERPAPRAYSARPGPAGTSRARTRGAEPRAAGRAGPAWGSGSRMVCRSSICRAAVPVAPRIADVWWTVTRSIGGRTCSVPSSGGLLADTVWPRCFLDRPAFGSPQIGVTCVR